MMSEKDLIALIEETANRCLNQWEEHFSRFYLTELPGDKQKKDGIKLGIKSFKDDLLSNLRVRGQLSHVEE